MANAVDAGGASADRTPTSVDVARKAGVSRTTVSYVLNGAPGGRISPETRARVHRAARELGYRPNAAARALRAGRSDEIYAFIPGPLSPFVGELIVAMQERVRALDYTLVVYFDDGAPGAHRREMLARTFARRPSGIFATPLTVARDDLARARRAGVGPCVFLSTEPMPGAPTIVLPSREAGRLATEHLLGRGRRRLGLVAPREPIHAATLAQRREGMRAALAAHGLPEPLVMPMSPTLEDARAVAAALAREPRRPEGIYGFSDEYSFPLLRALDERGLRIPDDVALVGTDDTHLCELVHPALTSIRFDIADLGRRFIDIIDALRREHALADELLTLPPPRLFARQSS